jgi:hypothetical protein
MRSTEHWLPRGPVGLSHNEELERLRDQFYQRLRDERTQLVRAVADLFSADLDARRAYLTLQSLGHRLCRAAAVYESSTLEEASRKLEEAAIDAIRRKSGNQDVLVWGAMASLMRLLPSGRRLVTR